MDWIIQRISPNEESVWLVKPKCGALRHISVPGAQDAFFKNDKLIIKSKTGYFWEIDPETGSRKRLYGQQPLI